MRAFVLILTLLCLAAPQAIAQDDGHGGNGQRNENATGQGNGNGQANGNGSDKGQGNGNGSGTKGDGNGPDRHSGNGNSQGKTDRGSRGNDGNSGNGPGGDDTGTGTGTDTSGSTDANGTIHFSQDYARDVVNRGKAVSLGSLMPELQARSEGSVIDAELLNVRGILVYSIKVLRTDGRVTQEYYYAQSGRFIGSEP
jgi:hypothetical protein